MLRQFHFEPIYGAVKFILGRGCLAIAFLCTGLFGARDLVGMPLPIPSKNLRNATVFAAAPPSTIFVVPENCALSKLYAPPLYVRSASLNVQLRQSRPSRDCSFAPEIVKSLKIGVLSRGIKRGTAPSMKTPVVAPDIPPPTNTLRFDPRLSNCGAAVDAATICMRGLNRSVQDTPSMKPNIATDSFDISSPVSKLRQVIIYVISELARSKPAFSGFTIGNKMITKRSPVTSPENAGILNSSVNNEVYRLPVKPTKRVQIGMENSVRGDHASSGENNLFLVRFFAFCDRFPNPANDKILSRRLASVFNDNAYSPIVILLRLCGNITNGNPRSLIQTGVISCLRHAFSGRDGGASGSICGLFVGAIHFNCVNGVNKQQHYASNLHKRLNLIPPIILCPAGNLAMCLGWWTARRARCQRDIWCGVIGLYIGFPLAVWNIILTDMLGI